MKKNIIKKKNTIVKLPKKEIKKPHKLILPKYKLNQILIFEIPGENDILEMAQGTVYIASKRKDQDSWLYRIMTNLGDYEIYEKNLKVIKVL